MVFLRLWLWSTPATYTPGSPPSAPWLALNASPRSPPRIKRFFSTSSPTCGHPLRYSAKCQHPPPASPITVGPPSSTHLVVRTLPLTHAAVARRLAEDQPPPAPGRTRSIAADRMEDRTVAAVATLGHQADRPKGRTAQPEARQLRTKHFGLFDPEVRRCV
ncbi:unnamed protein product [Pylaiella littoralis]